MTLTLDNLPANVLDLLQKQADAQHRSVKEVAADAIAKGLGVNGKIVGHDFSDIAGTWVEDPEFDEAMKYFEQIDPEQWK